ncbi:MAG: MarR family transcriptional regulator [Candidatus Dormibacteraeota bacterium]|nr:MarR family transcriptional regulator [Candidatus Dormibacteraeota bacterium]
MTDEIDGLPPSMRERVSFYLYRDAITATGLADGILRELDLTARQVGILTLVIEREPMSQRALGETIGVDRTTMVALVDDLERRGYVERHRDPEDRRAFLIQPTEAGAAAQKRAVELLDECERRYLAVLDPEEQRQLLQLLARLYNRP